MEKIDKNKYKKKYVKEYHRVFLKSDLEEERQSLVERIAEIDALLDEIKHVKDV